MVERPIESSAEVPSWGQHSGVGVSFSGLHNHVYSVEEYRGTQYRLHWTRVCRYHLASFQAKKGVTVPVRVIKPGLMVTQWRQGGISWIQGLTMVSLGTPMSNENCKWGIVTTTAWQGQGNYGLRPLGDEDLGHPIRLAVRASKSVSWEWGKSKMGDSEGRRGISLTG